MGIPPRLPKLGVMRAKRLLCLQVPQNLIVAGTGEGFHGSISPVDDLCQLLGGLQNLPATLEHKHREGSETFPSPWLGTGIWEPALWPAGVAGTQGKVREMWYLLIHLLLQVGEGHPQQVQRPASVPAQGIRELQGHSTASPLLSHLEATEEQCRPSDPSSPPALSCRDHPSAPGRPWCPGWMSR